MKNEKSTKKKFSKFQIIVAVLLVVSVGTIVYASINTKNVKEKTKNSAAITEDMVKDADSKDKSDKDKEADKSVTENKDKKSDNMKTAEKTEKNKSKDSKKGKTWVPPVYKTVEHPAVTHTVHYYVTRRAGKFYSMEALRAAQAAYLEREQLNTCDGTYTIISEGDETVVDKAAWTEKVLVKEGYWK